MATRIVYKRSDGRWAWRLKAPNGLTIAADGGPGYETESDCRTIADRVISGYYLEAERKIRR